MKKSLGELIFLKKRTFPRNEKMSRAQLEAMQLRKFRRLAAFSQANSPYYADIIKTRSIDVRNCVPQDFPILTKPELMANFDRIVTDPRISKLAITEFFKHSKDPAELYLNQFYAVHTSGSSGEVGIFVFSRKDWARGLAQMGRLHIPVGEGMRKKAATFNASDGHYAAISWTKILNQPPFNHNYDLLSLEISDPLPSVVAQLNTFQPNSLSGYVNGIKMLGEELRKGHLKISLTEIGVGGEVLTVNDKNWIEETFGCPVINYYASTEHMYMGRSLAGQTTIHLWEDDLIFELHKDHTTITNLFNLTLPLIRYRMDDVLKPSHQKSSTWPYTEIDGLIGRTENPPKFINQNGDEDFISPHAIAEIFVPGVLRFQMQLLSKTAFRFLARLDPEFNDQQVQDAIAAVKIRIKEILARKLMTNVAFEIVISDDIPIDRQSRKFRLILDRSNL